MWRWAKGIIFFSVLLSTCTVANADVAATQSAISQIQNLSNFYDAGRIGNQLQQKITQAPKVSPRPQLLPPKTSRVSNADKIHFKLTSVIIKGNTVFPKRVFTNIFRSSINHVISLADLENMVHEITIKYRETGYILTRAILPLQTIRNGVVTVQIVEGYISGIVIKGNVGSLRPLLQDYGKHVMHSRPLQIHVLERYALLANDLPGVSVQTVITPSKNIPAGADLTLFVTTRQRASGYLAFDNYGTRYIGPNETTIGGSLYSIFVPGDNNSVRFSYTSRTSELHFAEFIHAQPLGSRGLHWQIGSDYTETRPEFILQPLEIIGRNFLLFNDFSYPIIRDRSRNWIVHTTANYQNVTATIIGQPFYQDRIRSLVVGTNFDNTDDLHGITSVFFNLTHGFPIFGAKVHALQSRPNGQASYTRVNGSLSRLQALNSRFSLYGIIQGQYSFEALLATEQYGVGGADVGRGYDPSEIVGDRGLSGKLELRLDTTPGRRFLSAVEYYIFYDAGIIWNIDYINLPAEQSLVSTGAGARFMFTPNLNGNFYIAKPLTRPVATLKAINHNPNQLRTFFQIVLSA